MKDIEMYNNLVNQRNLYLKVGSKKLADEEDELINRKFIFIDGVGIVSKGRFKLFLDCNLKNNIYNFDEYIKDLKNQLIRTGLQEYELSRFLTKSGDPAIFNLEILVTKL